MNFDARVLNIGIMGTIADEVKGEVVCKVKRMYLFVSTIIMLLFGI